jgi:hypothetical protein
MSEAEDLKAELERLKAENEQLKSQRGRAVSLKVSEKGGVGTVGQTAVDGRGDSRVHQRE